MNSYCLIIRLGPIHSIAGCGEYKRVGLLLVGHRQVEKAEFMIARAQQHNATKTLASFKISQAWASSWQGDVYAHGLALS